MSAAIATSSKAGGKQKFQDAWPRIQDELIAYLKSLNMPADAVEYYTKVSCLPALVSCSASAEIPPRLHAEPRVQCAARQTEPRPERR